MMRFPFFRTAVIAALVGYSGIAVADFEPTSNCYRGQVVLGAFGSGLQDKAVDALERANGDVAEVDATLYGILVTEPEALDDPQATESCEEVDDPCERLRRQYRVDLKRYHEGELRLPPRRFDCDPNIEFAALATPNDPMMSNQWGVTHSGDKDMNLPEAWNLCTGSDSTVVAVIDTGVDYNHADLAANMWRNTGEVAGNGIDDDSNGYVDDVHGINAITLSGNPMDDHGHGTHVAGTIGARGNNGLGVVGVNWQVKIMGVKFLSSSGSGSLWDAMTGIEYITNMRNRGVPVVLSNNSWGGGGYSASLYNAIVRAKTAGLLFVAAAGNNTNNNDTNPSYPASYNVDNVVAVAATTVDGGLASFSNYGATNVDIGAPGYGIASTYPGNQYTYMSGTSMASPHVAGALALLSSYTNGTANWQVLRNVLLSTGRPLSSLSGKVATGAMVNAEAMLVYARDNHLIGPTPTPTSTPTPLPTATPTPTPTPTPTIAPGYYQVSGRLIGTNGAVAGAKLVLNSGGITVVRYSGQNGEFNFGGVLGPASYTITVLSSGHSFVVHSSTILGHTVVDLNGQVKKYKVSGTVLAPNGTPVPGITIDGGAMGQRTTDAQGKFTFLVDYGTRYSITASSPNYGLHNGVVEGTVFGNVERSMVAVASD